MVFPRDLATPKVEQRLDLQIRNSTRNLQLPLAVCWHTGQVLFGVLRSVSYIRRPFAMESCQRVSICSGELTLAYLTAPNNAASHASFNTLKLAR